MPKPGWLWDEYRTIVAGLEQGTLKEPTLALRETQAKKVERGIGVSALSTIATQPCYSFGTGLRSDRELVYDKDIAKATPGNNCSLNAYTLPNTFGPKHNLSKCLSTVRQEPTCFFATEERDAQEIRDYKAKSIFPGGPRVVL
jgi:hypothetical protein